MEAVNSQISEAQKIANGGGSEQDIAEAKIELEVSSLKGKSSIVTNSFPGSGESASLPEVDWPIFDSVNTTQEAVSMN